MATTTETNRKAVILHLTDAELGTLEDALQQYRDQLAATVERFDLCADESLPVVKGGILATLYDADYVLHLLETV